MVYLDIPLFSVDQNYTQNFLRLSSRVRGLIEDIVDGCSGL